MNTTAYASEAELVSALRTGQPGAFASLYDQYAPGLLGVITKISGDEQRAESILTETFTAIRSGIEHCPTNQPLFLWLFDMARQTAADALATGPKRSASTVQLTSSGRMVAVTGRTALARTTTTTNTRQQLLNAVLFERCTPQEASHAAGLPTENARQHLRQAFLQLREQAT